MQALVAAVHMITLRLTLIGGPTALIEVADARARHLNGGTVKLIELISGTGH